MDMISAMQTYRQRGQKVGIEERLLARLEAMNLTQADLARKTGIMPAQIGRYLKGTKPSANVAIKLAMALETSIDYLLSMTDDPEPFPNLTSEERKLFRAWRAGDFDTVKAILLPRIAQAFRDNPDLLDNTGGELLPRINGE